MGDAIGTAGVQLRRALIVDDHPLFCDALRMTLSSVGGIEAVATTGKLAQALELLAADNQTADIVFLDLNLPDVNGLDGLVRLRTARPELPVVVVSSMAESRIIASAFAAGAVGYVPKHSGREVFQRAIDTIRAGGRFRPDGWVPPEAGGTAPEDAVARLGQLTNQQARILQLICEGKLNKQIAYDLSIAETTVKAHVTAIMRKLGVQSRTQAVLIAQKASFANLLPSEGGGA